MNDGREADLEQLRQQLKRAKTPRERAEIEAQGRAIQKQRMNGKVRAMREQLIKESRNGNTANVRDINEYIRGKIQYED